MLLVADVAERHRRAMTDDERALFGIDKLNVPRSSIPAVTHVDYSARIQTVHKETNAAFHDLLKSFKAKTGYSVVVNTSFNVRGEPIVCTPEDAFRCFMGSEIEVLVVGNCFLRKEDQDPALKARAEEVFAARARGEDPGELLPAAPVLLPVLHAATSSATPKALPAPAATRAGADIRLAMKFRIAFASPLARPDSARLRLQVTVSTTT